MNSKDTNEDDKRYFRGGAWQHKKMRRCRGGPQRRHLKTRSHIGVDVMMSKHETVQKGAMLMGDVVGGDVARTRWMEKDVGRKQ